MQRTEIPPQTIPQIHSETIVQPNNISKAQDYFLKHIPQQPKNGIADYVQQQGILVPRRFKDLTEALAFLEKEQGSIIIRSEHPQEYA